MNYRQGHSLAFQRLAAGQAKVLQRTYLAQGGEPFSMVAPEVGLNARGRVQSQELAATSMVRTSELKGAWERAHSLGFGCPRFGCR
jgi:hypothetical protein